ncbi:protein phosphatase 1 regulatory subunit 37 isoform X3 [Alosa sapidissima]|uniref:protein phosphatase 1 regulatory subunit 37 isoform X3 n=1 Tax=Alosa sapidissima TaxID=34773 RepID=UPI001C081C33|nr:protein phosphatase 1 regulatory subunit 37 isoform X3 [Alosa sapidissima]
MLDAGSDSIEKDGAGKHVSFPPDEEIVSGFAEFKGTQSGGGSPTVADIISAYEQSCEKHQVEPSLKAVEQIKLVASVGMRAGCLDLRGEQLDYCSCESLEDILKFIQFDSINLQETELEENGASSLLEMILYYESACQLNISSNVHMGFAGWKALAHLTRQSSCLWRLDACSMPMVEYPAQALSKALLASRLTVLHLDGANLSGRPLFTLVGTLKQNAVLQELSLASNGLNSYQDAMQLGDLLNSNRCLLLLDLSNNLLADEGLEEICAGLTSQQSGLRSLVLLNNQITHAGMVPLANVLPDLKTLESLKLDQNQLQNEGVHILKEALMRNRSILVLGLADTQITCEGAVALAEFIAESPQIRHLDVRRNHILCGGLMAISLALRINHSLIALDLDQTRKAEKEEFLIETQQRLLRSISDLCAEKKGKEQEKVKAEEEAEEREREGDREKEAEVEMEVKMEVEMEVDSGGGQRDESEALSTKSV